MRALGLLLIIGCKFSNSATGDDVPSDGKLVDAMIDAPKLDAFDPLCFGGGAFYHCFTQMPMSALTITSNINTSTCTNGAEQIRTIDNTSVCVIAGDSISIASSDVVEVTGTRPLVLIAVTNITIDGVLDASSSPTRLGPAANATCNGGTGTTSGAGGGGGAGGSFGSRGGGGGTGSNNATPAGTSMPAVMPPVNVLRGGCKGGNGAPGTANPAEGGDGGGALYIVSRGQLAVSGTINASGEGGLGGLQSRGGGGGGGSGGMIVFHAGTFTVSSGAKIIANGGGGGGGATSGSNGDDGSASNPTNPATQPAPGGPTNTGGESSGGDGAAGSTPPEAGMNGPNGGGGGGGGLGVIRVLAGSPTFPSGAVSPTPTN